MEASTNSPSKGAPPWPIYPLALAIGFWLSNYNTSAVDLSDAVRSGAWLALGSVAVLLLAVLALGRAKGGLVAFLAIAVFLRLYVVPLLVLAGFVGLTLVRMRARRTGRPVRTPTGRSLSGNGNAVAIITMVLLVVTGVASGTLGWPRVIDRPAEAVGTTDPSLPDIYLIMLDGHPSLETLEVRLGYDTDEFAANLDERGFEVLPSRANYTWTPLTLLSMLNARHVDALVPPPHPDGVAPQFRRLMEALRQDPAAWAPFREAGYMIGSIPSPYVEYGLKSADRYLDSEELNSFELDLLSETLLADTVPGLFSSQIRSRTLAALEATAGWAQDVADRPRLLLTHLLIPHAPFVFRADGGDAGLAPCFPRCSALSLPRGDAQLRHAMYLDQLQFTHDRVIELVDEIAQSSARHAVIVLFSDHGSRLFPNEPHERLENFMAVRTPDGRVLIDGEATPMDLFPALAREYLGVTIAADPDGSFMSPMDRPWPLQRSPAR